MQNRFPHHPRCCSHSETAVIICVIQAAKLGLFHMSYDRRLTLVFSIIFDGFVCFINFCAFCCIPLGATACNKLSKKSMRKVLNIISCRKERKQLLKIKTKNKFLIFRCNMNIFRANLASFATFFLLNNRHEAVVRTQKRLISYVVAS